MLLVYSTKEECLGSNPEQHFPILHSAKWTFYGMRHQRVAQYNKPGKGGKAMVKGEQKLTLTKKYHLFFKRATSLLRKENTDTLSSRARHHAAPLEMQDKPNQTSIQPGHHGRAGRGKSLSRGGQNNNVRHPLERTLPRSPSCLQNSPHRSKPSTSTNLPGASPQSTYLWIAFCQFFRKYA